jgi:uncharacterized protein (TIGR02466 family)
MNPEYGHLFPAAIQNIILELDTVALTEFCYEMKRKDTKGVVKTNVGGWQSDNILNETHEEFTKLKNKVVEAANLFHQHVEFNKSSVQKLANIWININQKGHSNDWHTHPESIFSGVFYLYGKAAIIFQHPYRDLGNFYWLPKLVENWNIFNSGVWSIFPSPNTLLLFPPWLYHKVDTNNEDKDRISFSFNTILTESIPLTN